MKQLESKARLTDDLLSDFTHLWSSSPRIFEESHVILHDISKAFVRVWHKSLLAKPPSYGFTPPLCNLITSFYLIALYLLLLTAQHLLPLGCQVGFCRDLFTLLFSCFSS